MLFPNTGYKTVFSVGVELQNELTTLQILRLIII